MKRVLIATGAGSALLIAALFLTLTASAAKTKSAGGNQPSCYPGNEATISSGDTWATLKNAKITAKFEIEPSYNTPVPTIAKGWVKANMAFTVVDGTSIAGFANAEFQAKGYPAGKFKSRCIQEASTDSTCCGESDDFEAEFEGTITGLPWSPQPQKGILSLSGHNDNGTMILHANFEQGTTCDEYHGEIGSTNEDNPGSPSGTLSAGSNDSGRWGLPGAYDPNDSNPCQDVSS